MSMTRSRPRCWRGCRAISCGSPPASAVAVLCLSGLLSRVLTRKIGQLLTAIREVREGAYSHRAEVAGHDEIAQLARSSTA